MPARPWLLVTPAALGDRARRDRVPRGRQLGGLGLLPAGQRDRSGVVLRPRDRALARIRRKPGQHLDDMPFPPPCLVRGLRGQAVKHRDLRHPRSGPGIQHGEVPVREQPGHGDGDDLAAGPASRTDVPDTPITTWSRPPNRTRSPMPRPPGRPVTGHRPEPCRRRRESPRSAWPPGPRSAHAATSGGTRQEGPLSDRRPAPAIDSRAGRRRPPAGGGPGPASRRHRG